MARTKQTAKPTDEIAELKAIVAGLTEQLSKLTSKGAVKAAKQEVEVTVTEAEINALNAEDWDTLRYLVVERDDDGNFVLERNQKGTKQYKLVKNAQRRWYMVCRGFAQTLQRGNELSDEQVTLGQEVLSEMKAAGFLGNKANSPKAKANKRSSK